MLSKNRLKPCFIASTTFSRNSTGSRLMSSIADIAWLRMCPKISGGKFISRRISSTTTWITTAANRMIRLERVAELVEDLVERLDRRQQATRA